MRLGRLGGLDGLSLGLLAAGALLLAAALVGAVVLVAPAGSGAPAPAPTPVVAPDSLPPDAAVPADRVATVLEVDAAADAASVARSGDHIDVLGYFGHASTGGDGVTRPLLEDVPIVSVARSGATVELTLAVPQDGLLLLQEAQALGARTFVALRSTAQPSGRALPPSFSDADLANRISPTGPSAAGPADGR
jgi:hypothetical protein